MSRSVLSFRPIRRTFTAALSRNQFTANADVRRAVDLGLAKATNVALGVEYRRETYQIIAGGSFDQTGRSAGTPGAQVFPGFRPANEVDASRNSVAAYVDLEGDVGKA